MVCPALAGAPVLEIWTKDGTGIAKDGPVHFQSLSTGRMTGAETGTEMTPLDILGDSDNNCPKC